MTRKDWALAGLILLVAAQAVVTCAGSSTLRRERITAANELAAASRTERRLVGQLQVATRYIYQGQLELEKALRDRPATPKVAVDLTLESRHDTGTVSPQLPRAWTTSVRFRAGYGNLDSSGYRVENDVLIQGVGPILGEQQRVNINYDVTLAPARYRIRVSCEGSNVRVGVAGPRWRSITIDSTSRAADEVCNPPPRWEPFSFKAPSVPVAAGLVGLGVVLRSLFSN